MTPKEVLEEARDALKVLTYTGTANKIFSERVHVSPDVPIEQLPRFANATAFIIDQGQPHDPEWPGLIILKFSILFFIENFNSPYGTGSLLDANRTANTSKGVGAKSVEHEIILQLTQKTELNSKKVVLVSKNANKAQQVGGKNRPNIFKTLNFEAFCSVY